MSVTRAQEIVSLSRQARMPRNPLGGMGAPSTRGSMPQPKLSKCAMKYALAISDPFHPAAKGVCVPNGSTASSKVHAYARTTTQTGAGLNMMIYLCPSVANDMPSIYYTTSAWPGVTNTPYSVTGVPGLAGTASTLNTGWAALAHNGPYTALQCLGGQEWLNTQTTPNVVGKIVSSSVRVNFIGSDNSLGGLTYCFHSPDHSSVSGSSEATLGAFNDTVIMATGRDPCVLSVFAVTEAERNWPNTTVAGNGSNVGAINCTYPLSGGSAQWSSIAGGATDLTGTSITAAAGTTACFVGCPVGVARFTSVSAGVAFQIEYITHMEYSGSACASTMTPVDADDDGASMVATAALMLPSQKMDNPKKTGWELMYNGLSSLTKKAMPYAVPLIEDALLSLLL